MRLPDVRHRLLVPAAAVCVALAAACSGDAGTDTTAHTGATAATETTVDTTAGTTGEVASTVPEETDVAAPGAVTTEATGGPQTFGSARLGFFSSCPALLEHMKTEALARVTPWGLEGGFPGFDEMAAEEAMVEDGAADGEIAVPAVPAPGFSGTNTQELDVDEGDVVETDGAHVYVAGDRGLRIVSVADAEVVAEPDLPEGSHQLLLDGTRLLVVTSSWTGSPDTIASLYDVADPTGPRLVSRTHLEGTILATRASDGVARLVVSTSLQERLPFVFPDQFGLDEERALERNREIIEESDIEDWLPRRFEESADGAFGPITQVLDCTDVAAPRDFSGLGVTWIGSLDLHEGRTPAGSAGIVSTGDTVYASSGHLYVATRNWAPPIAIPVESGATDATEGIDDRDVPDEAPATPPTLIHQFVLGPGEDASYRASGEVAGRLLGQFAMSEHDGDLRVATTTDAADFGERTESSVHVLRPDGDELATISSIDGLGIDEQIYAVRFLGDVGYVVTFRQVDPLYVIDLTDPEAPVLQGELKIPGYSSYLHPVGEDLLLGVGQDATDDGRPTGTQLSLFDVSEPRDPRRIDTLPIGGSSEVEWDHRAFLYWAPDGTIVLPVSPGWADCGPNDDCIAGRIGNPAGGVVVAELDGRELSARGTLSHPSRGGSGCWNPLVRSIAIGDELATVGLDQIQFADRRTLEVRDGVSWGEPEEFGCWWYVEDR